MGRVDRKTGLKIAAILSLAALFDFFAVYYSHVIESPLREYPFIVDIVGSIPTIIIAVVAMLWFKKFCPSAYQNLQSKLSESSAQPVLGFRGWRKIVLLISLAYGLTLLSGQISRLYNQHFGIELVESRDTDKYVDSTVETSSESRSLAVIKNISGRFVRATSEELLFRWVFLGGLLVVLSLPSSVILSSLMFGLSHIIVRLHDPTSEMLMLFVPTMIIGVGLSMLYIRGGLLICCVIHALINLSTALAGEPIQRAVTFFFFFCILFMAPIIFAEAGIKRLSRVKG